MIFHDVKSKVFYYLFLVSFFIISFLLFSSLFYLKGLTLIDKFLLFFFGFYFLQIGIVFILTLLYYNFTQSEKERKIKWEHVFYIGGAFSFLSVLPLELGIAILIIKGSEGIFNGFLLIFCGLLVLVGFILAYFVARSEKDRYKNNYHKTYWESNNV